jgi:hypothetical protein
MSSIESVSKALYAIHTAEDKLKAAQLAAIEWENVAVKWERRAKNADMAEFARTVLEVCRENMYRVFTSRDEKKLLDNAFSAYIALSTIAQLWQAMASEDE